MIQEGFLEEEAGNGQKDILGRRRCCETCTAFSVTVLLLPQSRKALRTAIAITFPPHKVLCLKFGALVLSMATYRSTPGPAGAHQMCACAPSAALLFLVLAHTLALCFYWCGTNLSPAYPTPAPLVLWAYVVQSPGCSLLPVPALP